MHLELTPDQVELRESARSTLARECPPRLVRDVVHGRTETTQLTKTLAWLGWTALPIPTDQGGLGQGSVELAIVLEELGRVAAPGPFLATMTQFVPVVREAGTGPQTHRFLSGVATGEVSGTLAVHDSEPPAEAAGPAATSTTAVADGEGWILTGRKRHVLCGAEVDEVVIPARRDDGRLALFTVPAAELTFHPRAGLDPTRPVVDIDLAGVWVPATRMLGEDGRDAVAALGRAVDEATIGAALDAIGACDALVEAAAAAALEAGRGAPPDGPSDTDTPAAVNGRHVSGRHVTAGADGTLGRMIAALEPARAMTYQAVASQSAGDTGLPITVRCAAEAVARAQRTVAAGTLELVTDHRTGAPVDTRLDVELWARRSHASALLLGTATEHRLAIADHLLGNGPPAGPAPTDAVGRDEPEDG
ncbi:MAG TPA: acyl-CoA dehydrogenase family protein [Acidimicrobiales bacterium]